MRSGTFVGRLGPAAAAVGVGAALLGGGCGLAAADRGPDGSSSAAADDSGSASTTRTGAPRRGSARRDGTRPPAADVRPETDHRSGLPGLPRTSPQQPIAAPAAATAPAPADPSPGPAKVFPPPEPSVADSAPAYSGPVGAQQYSVIAHPAAAQVAGPVIRPAVTAFARASAEPVAVLSGGLGSVWAPWSGSDPVSPSASAVSWLVLGAVRRQLGGTKATLPQAAVVTTGQVVALSATALPAAVTNSPPVITKIVLSNPNSTSGAVTGTVTASDPDADAIGYRAVTSYSRGQLTIAAGVFIFTPSATARHAAARVGTVATTDTVTVTVTVTDAKGAAVSRAVTVPILPANKAPTATVAINKPDPVTGIAVGKVTASDTDRDALSYRASTPASGSVAMRADGGFTYTPTVAARAAARVSPTPRTDAFTITVTDGYGGSRAVAVTATIAPANSAPTAGPATVGAANPTTGVVTGTVSATDPDGDAITYTAAATSTPKGAVSVTTAGAFSFTPTAAARHAAARIGAATAAKTDTVTIAATDSLGARTVIPLSVPISPKNTAPVAGAPVVGAPNAATGVVTGTVTATDADSDTLTYTVPAGAAKGSVSVTATGAFTYTPTTDARQKAAAPGATGADRTDGFTVSIADGYGGTAAVQVTVAVSPAEQPPSAVGQLRPADLSFEGFFRVPTGQLAAGQYATLAYGGAAMASRVVDGQRHFLLTGHRYANDPLVELVAPANLGDAPGTAPVATLYRYWGDVYGGRKITAEEPDPTQANANWTEGLLWDQANQRVLWSYGNWYAAQRVNNPVLGATLLGADGSITVQGPWRTTSESQQTRSLAVVLSPAVSAATDGATLGLGGKMQSINASASWGLSLHVIVSPSGDPGIPVVAQTLISHPISPTNRRTPRAVDYQVARNPDGSLDSAGTEPPVGGVGFWTELDETTGAVFAHTGSNARSALVYAGGQASGLIWYGPDLEHGVADGRGYSGSGNHAQAYRPVLWFVSEADVVAAAEGRVTPDQVNPYATVDLISQFPELSFLAGLSAGQPVFAEDEARLYVPFAGGTTEGREPYPIIAVFSIAG